MSNTVITNYTDLNGPSSKADSSVVVIVNKDGSLSVDQNLLGTLMGTDGSQSAGISVVRVGHEGRPDDATDSESEDDKIPHVTLTVDSYYDEPNSIIKYDSGAEMLQSLRIETRENSLIGFQNDHCYTPLTSPGQVLPQRSENFATYDDPVIEISHTPPPKPVPSSKKITILEQQIIPKGKKIHINPPESPVILKGNVVLSKPLPALTKPKEIKEIDKELKEDSLQSSEDSTESTSTSGDSIPDRDSDSDYRDRKEPSSAKLKKPKAKARILQPAMILKSRRADPKVSRLKLTQHIVKKEIKEIKNQKQKSLEKDDALVDLESLLPSSKIAVSNAVPTPEFNKVVVKQAVKPAKKEKKIPSHPALLTDMTALFSTPDVIRRVSTDNKTPGKVEKEVLPSDKKPSSSKLQEVQDGKASDSTKLPGPVPQTRIVVVKVNDIVKKDKIMNSVEKASKHYEPIPQLDDVSLAQILQDTTSIPSSQAKSQSIITTPVSMASPGLAGPLSPTLDLLGGLPPEEDLSEDLLMHVAQLVESSENLQEVIDKQVLGKVDSLSIKSPVQSPFQQAHASNLYTQTLSKTVQKTIQPRKEPIEIVRRDGRVITLPPIEAPATRSSKRKSQITNESSVNTMEVVTPVVPAPSPPMTIAPEPQLHTVSASKQYVNKKLANKKQEAQVQPPVEKSSAESQESWNSEDDPYRLWCICKQPHNNRFMICCDGCEDWFHGKCVNITKAMGQQMEDQGIEWRCPNCVKRTKAPTPKSASKGATQKRHELLEMPAEMPRTPTASGSKTGCIVCKKPARASSIYCSDACILKHAQDSLGNQGTPTKSEAEPGKLHEKQKSDSRVIVYERKSGRLLAGPNAPTAENLKAWLQKNPTFEVVRPGALSSIKPGTSKKKLTPESTKIQTTLNFERIPRKTQEQTTPTTSRGQQLEGRERRALPSPKEEKLPKAPTPKPIQLLAETPKPSTSTAKPISEPRKLIRSALNRSQSNEKPAPSPSTSRRKDSAASESRTKMSAPEVDIRENVRKSLQEQMSLRMAETKRSKFTEDDIQAFAEETELELHELFRDTGMKYKAKYRSLMFNIKDRKNLSLWEKICGKFITPKQLVRLSPDELASQELAQWRDQESKYQLELIKKSELDLLAASKTYVLKTHKGEEVMETKEATELELDPNVPVEDVVTALNDSTVGEEVTREVISEGTKNKSEEKEGNTSSRKRERDSSSSRSKRSRRDSRRGSDRKSRASRRKSELKEKESKEERRRSTRRAEKKSRTRSSSRERIKRESKEKSDSSERSRLRSRSRDKVKKRSKSREHSRSTSKGRETSRSIERSRRRSESRDTSRRRNRSRSKHARSDEKSIHRSRSQENYIKNKTDSTDSDSIERPKSAMLKEPHPEYDPHEPMITSAFSEEDLRKPEDAYEDLAYKSEIVDAGAEYDPNKSFTLDTSIILPSTTFTEKASEAESDQEPSSTVENSAATVWNGCINMVDVARFYVLAYEVSGSTLDLEEDLSTELDIVGRINPETVWDYITKTKKTSNKDIIILRLQAANDEEKMQYIALYSYLSSRNRLGVVKVPNTATVKDFYIVPLPAHAALQPVLLPLDGPGLGEAKTHLLIAVIIRQRRKRLAHHIPKNLVPAKVSRGPRKRSYTPPVGKTYTPPTSPRRRALPLPAYTSTALSTSVKDKIAASLACADVEEAYSPGSSSSSGGAAPAAGTPPAAALRNKMEELNRQIEEQKQQILKMAQADSSMGGEDDEAYSPSRPMTPPASTLADISLPSNLQEILATIKQRSENPSTDVDMRNLPLP